MDKINALRRNLSIRLKKAVCNKDEEDEDLTAIHKEEKKCVTWTVENIHVCPLDTGEFLESPPFYSGHLGSTKWILRLYPSGRNASNSKKVGLFIYRVSSAEKCSVNYWLKLRNSWFTEGYFDNKVFENLDEYGTDEFLSSDDLSVVKHLQIECNMLVRYLGEAPKYQISDEGFSNCTSNLAKDLKNLYLQEKHTDALLKVGETKMPVHKAILGARSRVLYDIFKSDQKKGSCPDIIPTAVLEGPADESIMRSFLEYIYTGKIDDVTVDKAVCLYPLAKKYSLTELKMFCLTVILTKMSVENFCCIAALASMYPSSKIKLATKNFFCSYSAQIMKRDDWKTFICERRSMASEMMEALASEMKTKSQPTMCENL